MGTSDLHVAKCFFVRAPWIKHFVINDKRDKLTYVLPRTDSVVLGGTTQVGNWDEIVNPDTAHSSWKLG